MNTLMTLKRGLMIQSALLLSLCFMWASESFAVTKEEAIQIADKEIQKLRKFGYDHTKWEVLFDEDNREWGKTSSFYKRPSAPNETRRYFERQESKLRDKQYFAIRYRYDRKPRLEVKDGVAWVFVEKETGKVLLVIKPGE
jgi:hypothetical protein